MVELLVEHKFSKKIIWEIGKNHLGSVNRALELMAATANLDAKAVSIQIREKEFYEQFPNLQFTNEQYFQLIKFAKSKDLKVYLAVGPTDDKAVIEQLMPLVDGVKLLYLTLSHPKIVDLFYNKSLLLNIPVYISTGALTLQQVKKIFVDYPGINLLYTKLSHSVEGQKISQISEIRSSTGFCAFGQHSKSWLTVAVAIGAGADEVFVYFGDKALALPDLEHALDLSELDKFLQYVNLAYSSLDDIPSEPIAFIG